MVDWDEGTVTTFDVYPRQDTSSVMSPDGTESWKKPSMSVTEPTLPPPVRMTAAPMIGCCWLSRTVPDTSLLCA